MNNPLGLLYSYQLVILLACAAAYYKAADMENASPLLWAGLSAGIFLFTWRFLGWGLPGDLVGQAALLAGITLVRLLRDR
jgi:hypothetical protein